MQHTQQINILDCVVRNISGTFDLYIFDPKFTRFNINIVSLCIKDSENIESNILENYNYKVYIAGAIIYNGKLKSNANLFSHENIPFTELYNQKLYLCITNIDPDIIKKIINYKIEFKWVEFNLQLAGYNINNNFYQMDWTLYGADCEQLSTSLDTINITDESTEQAVKLGFFDGLVGTSRTDEHYSENFINSNTYIYSSDQSNRYQLINLSHISDNSDNSYLFNSEIDIYGCNKLVYLLVRSANYFKNKIFLISEFCIN
jgi:hypothetical protein